jgi:hypothetical protein
MWGRRGRGRGRDRRQRSSRGEAKALARMVREVEAFLSGSSEDWFFTRGQSIPAWAYINKIAHADPDRLRQLAAWAPVEPSRCHGWREAVAILARETIEAGESDPRAIRRIQLDSLVGLELQLISRTSTVAPRALVALGRACLTDHP